MNRDYFYVGDEYEFVFYRIPKELVKNPLWGNITMEAKVLYSCMLDRRIHRRPRSFPAASVRMGKGNVPVSASV